MSDLVVPERELEFRWAPELVVLSFVLSWLGAYTCTQVAIHAKYMPKSTWKWFWTFLGSVVFGFSAIWCMHFVGMLACRLDVEATFNYPLTILSGLVSVGFTFLVLVSGYVMGTLENSKPGGTLSRYTRAFKVFLRTHSWQSFNTDTEYAPLDIEDSFTSSSRTTSCSETEVDDVPENARNTLEHFSDISNYIDADPPHSPTSETQSFLPPSDSPTARPTLDAEWTGDSHNPNEPHAPNDCKDWKHWIIAHYNSSTYAVAIKATIWGSALGFMHYCGIWAMDIPGGRIEWNLVVVAASWIIAFLLCFVGCIAMVHMEMHFIRQVIFSTFVAAGSCSMHYIGMAAATIHTTAPPSSKAGYPASLPFVVIGVAIFVCLVSNIALSHSVVLSRYRLEETIVTKRRLWKLIAEKEAAERANEVKQQFISVASHEIRTPLHAVNGYCELLSRTSLSDEQRIYLSGIQQACHGINVIVGNVLDFSKLDRNNTELCAQPTHIDLRKMLENQAKSFEVKGFRTNQHNTDIVVSVSKEVSSTVFLDESYVFRILMNLLSNAQKFTQSGYILVKAYMNNPEELAIEVSDTGCGMSGSFQGALFQPFQQANSYIAGLMQGTGLGLGIVKHLVQRMSGSIDFQSVEGEGTTFIVKLPVTLPPSRPLETTSPATQRVSDVLVKKRIRVVYHNPRTQRLFLDLWKKTGCTTYSGSIEMSSNELLADVDAIWVDVESVRSSRSLQDLVWRSPRSGEQPALYIAHFDSTDFNDIGVDVFRSRNVVLVKRPVIMDLAMGLLANPMREVAQNANYSLLCGSKKIGLALHDHTPEKRLLMEKTQSAPVISTLDKPSPPSSTSSQSPKGDEKMKILLVEDNIINQHLGKRLLEKLGYEVITASDGQQAVDIVLKTTVACCVMDCQMPVLDGFLATMKVRELETRGDLNGRLPIIALTAYVTTEIQEKCRAAGMDYFLSKPLQSADLDATIQYAVACQNRH
ncbi:hypothetical protein C8Q75DRAFT_765386 [Abortiporus biennis]|nr:hypothetical protein C8Q75DRAFT_765386 [Abortiporus biennis]